MPASPTIPSSIAPVPASAGKVKIVHWPAERATLAVLQKAAVPRLVIVDQLSEPPLSQDCCQDWMWQTGNEREIRMRSHQLSLRALAHGRGQPRLDALGLLHVGLRSVPLPPKEQALAALLLVDFGQPVQRDELVRAAWPEGITRANMLASRLSTMRARVAWLGLAIRGSTRNGYCLQATSPAPGPEVTGFEDELDLKRLGAHRAESSAPTASQAPANTVSPARTSRR